MLYNAEGGSGRSSNKTNIWLFTVTIFLAWMSCAIAGNFTVEIYLYSHKIMKRVRVCASILCPKGASSVFQKDKKKKKRGKRSNNQIFWFHFHMTQAMFFWYSRSFIAAKPPPSERQLDKYSSSNDPTTTPSLPTLFLLINTSNSLPHSLFCYSL